MNFDPDNYSQLPVIITILTVICCQLLYWFVLNLFRKRMIPDAPGSNKKVIINFFTARKLLGVFMFLLLPLFIALVFFNANPSELLFNPGISYSKLLVVSIAGLVIIPVSFFTSKQSKVYGMYPEMRINDWNIKLFLISAFGWAVYNFSYEFMFRGFLLQACLPLGTVNAIIINIILYSLLHLNKGWQEAVGAIPFGLVLCLVTIYSGTLIASFIVHTILSVSTEYFAIRNNPGMSFIRTKE